MLIKWFIWGRKWLARLRIRKVEGEISRQCPYYKIRVNSASVSWKSRNGCTKPFYIEKFSNADYIQQNSCALAAMSAVWYSVLYFSDAAIVQPQRPKHKTYRHRTYPLYQPFIDTSAQYRIQIGLFEISQHKVRIHFSNDRGWVSTIL